MILHDDEYIDTDFLEEMEIGDYFQIRGYTVAKFDSKTYRINSSLSGYALDGDDQMVQAIINNNGLGGASGGWTTSTGGLISTNLGNIFGPATVSFPHSLTTEEAKELEALEQEHKTFIKANRIKKFQNLPKHLRQEIVDEAYIRDLTVSLTSDDDKDFEQIAKLQALRNKNSFHNGYAVSMSGLSGLMHQDSFIITGKYSNIIKHFTTEEIAKAHADVTLEEAIN
jgi:hypothetical protein